MVRVVKEQLKAEVNVPPGEMVQFAAAVGAASLAQRRIERLRQEGRFEERLGGQTL
jgi:activator of 2-hydroxyglutaryl-CoA dehydratase